MLRFYGYFQEAVHEKREEQYRVRKCIILFYLEDDTIQVNEPQVENSGIPQGDDSVKCDVPHQLTLSNNPTVLIVNQAELIKPVKFVGERMNATYEQGGLDVSHHYSLRSPAPAC